MSYYAYRSAEIELTKDENTVLEELKKKYYPKYNGYERLDVLIHDVFNIGAPDIFYNSSIDKHVMNFYNDEKYCRDSYIEMLETLTDYIVQPATIEFRGEDDSFWKLVLEDGVVNEYSGFIAYDDEQPMVIVLKDVKKFIQEDKFKQYFGVYENANEVYNELRNDFKKIEDYYTPEKIKKLCFAIALTNYAYENEDDSHAKLDIPISQASDYTESIIAEQQL